MYFNGIITQKSLRSWERKKNSQSNTNTNSILSALNFTLVYFLLFLPFRCYIFNQFSISPDFISISVILRQRNQNTDTSWMDEEIWQCRTCRYHLYLIHEQRRAKVSRFKRSAFWVHSAHCFSIIFSNLVARFLFRKSEINFFLFTFIQKSDLTTVRH